jgi:phosphoglycerol transferase MdoB-like AlkP superfamily enzyme
MDTTIMGLEPGTSARVLFVAVVTAVMLALIIAVARRRQSYWWVSIASIAASYAGLALASYFAVRIFMGALANMAVSGGGIAAVRFGIWQATQPVLVAAWAAVVITLLAAAFVPLSARKELPSPPGAQRSPNALFALLTLLAFAVGAAPVLLFRRAIAFVLWAIDPRALGKYRRHIGVASHRKPSFRHCHGECVLLSHPDGVFSHRGPACS